MTDSSAALRFADLALPEFLQQSLQDVGYETPSAIQAQTIPPLLEGRDVLGQAQTGTGKTAAFALPVLARLDVTRAEPQVLVLTPTRELALQVSEAFARYAAHLNNFRVLPIYGGTDYRNQLRQLKRGVQVIVGTPGRVMDHIRRGSLKLETLEAIVLDEADEMLRMGFIDDVEWILEQSPDQRQLALFSATMPSQIKRLTQQYLQDAVEVAIAQETVTNSSIRQRVWQMGGVHKLDALTRILEVEDTDGIIIFVRTRLATVELAEKLAARGYETSALNGDLAQAQREKTVARLKSGSLDVLVATDVAARGLDVERISHVINYDIPYDAEAYVHRIGRTGRAGRQGEAILFVSRREQRLLRSIEKATGQRIEKMTLPTPEDVADKRQQRFMQKITEVLASEDLSTQREWVEQYQTDQGVAVLDIAAALAVLAGGKAPKIGERAKQNDDRRDDARKDRKERAPRGERAGRDTEARGKHSEKHRDKRKDNDRDSDGYNDQSKQKDHKASGSRPAMELFRIEVGHVDEVKPGSIVGAIANEAELDSQYIGTISIYDDHSTVELPEGMPKELYRHLKKVWVAGKRLQISRISDGAGKSRKPNKNRPSKRRER